MDVPIWFALGLMVLSYFVGWLDKAAHAELQELDRDTAITRFEVIDHRSSFTGLNKRIYAARNCQIYRSYQDKDTTLKVFVEDPDADYDIDSAADAITPTQPAGA